MNYFRITVYNPQNDFSAILDTNGKYKELWEFSAYLVSKGFKIIEVGKDDDLVDGTFQKIETPSDKIFLRGISRGRPDIQDMTYENRRCKAITIYDKCYGQFQY